MWDSKIEECSKNCEDINRNMSDKVNKECGFELKTVRYRDFVQTIKYIYQREGASAFTKGIGPRMCINVPSTALSWGTYELIKSFLARHDKD